MGDYGFQDLQTLRSGPTLVTVCDNSSTVPSAPVCSANSVGDVSHPNKPNETITKLGRSQKLGNGVLLTVAVLKLQLDN